MIPSMLSKLLPLAADPFPPTHKAGSEFEGFFIRLQSHSGRSPTSSQPSHSSPSTSTKPPENSQRRPSAKNSPSRIPRLTKPSSRTTLTETESGIRRRTGRSSSTSSSSSSASSSSHADPPSPTPESRRSSNGVLSPSKSTGSISPRTRGSISMLTDIDPVFASPESLFPPNTPSFHTNPFAGKAKSTGASPESLPTSPPGDLILVVCELQSAPIDQRICIYLRWIVHGEEPQLYQNLHTDKKEERGKERLPENAKGKQKEKEAKGESFEIVHYIPSWQLKVGAKVGKDSIQPFRIDLPSTLDDGLGERGSLGFMQVLADGKLVVDITLPNTQRSCGTKVRVRSTKHVPWHPRSSHRGVMGTKGPEGWIQHLGAALPLHWYVHSSSAPALFSIEHTPSSSRNNVEGEEGKEDLQNAVAAGRGLLHVEKNWGQAFPSGWMWAHGASPLPDPSLSSSSSPAQPQARISLAGGSILGLTAFLVGVHVKTQDGSEWDWNFTPPFALGPQYSFPSPSSSNEKVHFGPGIKMTRNFPQKHFKLDVWSISQWASIEVNGEEETFATQIPGPCKGGWTPAYCHHSYRCRAKVVLYERSRFATLNMPVKAALNPIKTLRGMGGFCRKEGGEGWDGIGWEKVVEVELTDRVALEFGGDFAQ